MHLHSYIDIHSHENAKVHDEDVYTIYSKYEQFKILSSGKRYSLGIHPWYIRDLEVQLNELRQTVNQPNVIAIGECGLDAIHGAPPQLQAAAFQKQIGLANECNKPLVIHCVRSFPQTFSILKQANVPVIFHGFNKKRSIADDILNRGYYLSFGADLLKGNSAAHSILNAIPADRIFFETDDSTVNIKEIYKAGCRIRKTEEEAIILQVQENFKTIFNF